MPQPTAPRAPLSTKQALDYSHTMPFLHSVLYLCERHGGSITSYYRTKARNALVGGHPNSRHLQALGVDVVLDDVHRTDAFTQEAVDLGLVVVDETDHLHVQTPRG